MTSGTTLLRQDTFGLVPAIVKHDLEITEIVLQVSTVMVGDFELSDHAGRIAEPHRPQPGYSDPMPTFP